MALRSAGLFYAAYFLFGGIQWPFFPLWLEAKGLDPRAIGFVIAVPVIERIVATPVVTHAADRRRALKAALVLSSAVGLLAMALLGVVQGLVAILLLYTVAAIASSPVLALTDAYALNGLSVRGRAYGPVRLWGSVAFIASNVGGPSARLDRARPPDLADRRGARPVGGGGSDARTADPREPAADAPTARRRDFWRGPEFCAVAIAVALVQPAMLTTASRRWNSAQPASTASPSARSGHRRCRRDRAVRVLGARGNARGDRAARSRRRRRRHPRAAMAFDPPVAALPLLSCTPPRSGDPSGAMAFLARTVPRELAATAQGTVATATGLVMAAATGAASA